MREALRKTSRDEWRSQLESGGPLRKLTARERREKYGATPEVLFDDEIPFGNERSTAHLPEVSPANREALERMLDAEGLPKILRTLRDLCDCRTPHDGAAFDSFEPDTEGEEAQENADELETLLLRLARRVKE